MGYLRGGGTRRLGIPRERRFCLRQPQRLRMPQAYRVCAALPALPQLKRASDGYRTERVLDVSLTAEALQAVEKAVVEVMEFSHPHRRGREKDSASRSTPDLGGR